MTFAVPKLSKFAVPKWGPFSGPYFGAAFHNYKRRHQFGVHFLDPKWGPRVPQKFVQKLIIVHIQAALICQWSRYLFKFVMASGKKPLLMNLDETSVPVVFTNGKGTIMMRNGRAA